MPSASSASSMKWFPPPSVPSASRQFLSVLVRIGARFLRQPLQRCHPRRGRRAQRRVVPAGAHRDSAFDAGSNRTRIPDVGSLQRGAHRDHSAADIDPDGGRDHRARGGQDGAHRRPLAIVTVGHHRHVLEHERHPGGVQDLLLCFELDAVPRQEHDDVLTDPLHDDAQLQLTGQRLLFLSALTMSVSGRLGGRRIEVRGGTNGQRHTYGNGRQNMAQSLRQQSGQIWKSATTGRWSDALAVSECLMTSHARIRSASRRGTNT